MNNYEGAYFEYYREKGMDYANDYHLKKSEGSYIHPRHLMAHYRYDGKTFTGDEVKIGIITAFGYEGVQEDMDLFCEKFSLPHTKISVFSHDGKTGARKNVRKSWATETALDLQWAHVFAPSAQKKCYFSPSDDISDIFEVMKKADEECDIVSLSFGKREFAKSVEYEDFFRDSKALFVCASGNNCAVNYPASSKYTLSVGGTSVYFYPDGECIGKERVFEKSGCGLAKYTAIPNHQAKDSVIRTKSAYRRSVPDMCFFADGNLACPVFVCGKLERCVGTSIGAPSVAGLCACIAEKDRKILEKKASYFYELAEKCHLFKRPPVFFDITSGRIGEYAAEIGFDICSGLGVPNFEEIFRAVNMLA
ncbi:MAG: S8 family serine peptidase [Clostridia bacterium]|nr:S8 family serine peptidase [Clostridia bacterium]